MYLVGVLVFRGCTFFFDAFVCKKNGVVAIEFVHLLIVIHDLWCSFLLDLTCFVC